MSVSRTEQTIDKMRYDLHDISKQLKRIADALERAYPKPYPGSMRFTGNEEATDHE